MADDHAITRDRIISSLFRKTNDGLPEDTYVGHVKIWEDVPPQTTQYSEEGGMKPRYLMVSITVDGQGHIYKGKRNFNDTFSIGKRWSLNDLRSIDVPDRSSLWLTIGRTYKWRIESGHDADLTRFVIATAQLYERLHPGSRLPVSGVTTPPLQTMNSRPTQDDRIGTNSGATSAAPLSAAASRRLASSEPDRAAISASSPPVSTPRAAFRPMSSSSYGSAPGSRAANTISTASSTPTHTPPISRTPFGSSLRTSTASGGATRSPVTPAPPLPDDRAAVNSVGSVTQTRSRPQTPQPAAAPPIRRIDSTSDSISEPKGSISQSSPSLRNRVPAHVGSQRPPVDDHERVPMEQAPYEDTGAVDRIHAAEPSFALALNELNSPTEDDYGFEVTMSNVEEIIDGFEWGALQVELDTLTSSGSKSGAALKVRSRGAADQIQSRLKDELSALEKANIHSFLESDDRVLAVMKLIDDTVAVIDDLDGYMSSYKVQLNTVAEDISYIQSRNRGLQVQTQNQTALLKEIERLLSTVHVDVDKLLYLSQGSPQTDEGIRRLEETAADLYKAMLAAREKGMAATMERLEEYRAYNTTFTTRLTQFLSVMFSAQATLVTDDTDPTSKSGGRSRNMPSLPSHSEMEAFMGRYSGLVLYTREMDENAYSKICATYFSIASELHAKEMKPFMTAYLDLSKKAQEDSEDIVVGFSPTTLSRMNTQIKRTNTVIRSPLERKDKDKDRSGGGSLLASEAFSRALALLTAQVYREENFIADFLQIRESNSNITTFADYMSLESYFRRQAARTLVLGAATKQLIRSALDLIFGFLPEVIKVWIDGALTKDALQLVGIMAALERFTIDAEERGIFFLQKLLQKQSQRMGSLFTKLKDDQIKAVEQTKLTTKKRKGVVSFIRYFPIFVSRLETQLIGADTLEIRHTVDGAYEQIVQIMFESLQQMAKMSDVQEAGGGEDKGVLNFHVILIENMHYFIAEVAQQELGAMQGFLRRAQGIYDDNLGAYVKLVLRRPMHKIMDYFDGIERLLKTTAPSQVSSNSSFNKSSLKRALKDYSSKDMRRNIDALYKRVEKHFSLASEQPGGGPAVTEEGSALKDVWTACQDEMVRETEKYARLIAQCYESTGVTLEFTAADVEQYFRTARRSK